MKHLCTTFLLIFISVTAQGASLELSKAPAPEAEAETPMLNEQIPQSTVAWGKGAIASAYLTSPTKRYDHGVLGDGIEAGSLTIVLDDGGKLQYILPDSRVFEDLVPRLVDLDGDGADEIVVVETDNRLGGSLAVYGVSENKLDKLASTPFIGRAYRWLNPVGAGDFNGDGALDLALVSTPHIGGILKLYFYTPPKLASYAQKHGVSTHTIGSTELGMGRVVKGQGKDLILAPNQSHDTLLLLEWVGGKIDERATVDLPSDIISALEPFGEHQWRFRVKDGGWYAVKATP